MKMLYNIVLLLFVVNVYPQKALTKDEIAETEEHIRNPYGRKNVGLTLPEITGINYTGRQFSSRQARRVTFYNFWHSGCAPCIVEIPMLMELKEKYNDKADFIAITFEDREGVKKVIDKHKFTYRQVLMTSDDIRKIEAASAYPTILIVYDNTIIYCSHGGSTPDSKFFEVSQEKCLKVYSEIIEKYLKK